MASPLPPRALLSAATHALGRGDVRAALRSYLERRFAAGEVLLYSSGTHALTAAMIGALACSASRVVALPAFACFDLATAAIGAGARVVLYDVDATTLAPDWDSFDAALATGAAAAVIAPLFGIPIDWERADAIARDYGVLLIEDAAQAAGGEWKGRPIGSLGAMSVLSFGRGKGWTGAGGGALLLRGRFQRDAPGPRAAMDHSPESAGGRDSMRAFVHACAQMLLSHPLVYGIPASMPFLHLGETRYKEPTPLRGMSRFSAALALATAEQSRSARIERARVAATCGECLRHIGDVNDYASPSQPDTIPGWLRYPVLVPARLRTHLVDLFARDGVASSYPLSLQSLPELEPHLTDAPRTTPGADRLAAELLTLPTHVHADPRLPSRLSSFFISQSRAD